MQKKREENINCSLNDTNWLKQREISNVLKYLSFRRCPHITPAVRRSGEGILSLLLCTSVFSPISVSVFCQQPIFLAVFRRISSLLCTSISVFCQPIFLAVFRRISSLLCTSGAAVKLVRAEQGKGWRASFDTGATFAKTSTGFCKKD